MNKYEKWYEAITKRGQSRQLDSYAETHHIIPQSLGGTDDHCNLTKLTAREHFICHWLLIKIYPNGEAYWKMLNALRMMRAENPYQQRYETKITSRVYSRLKEEYSGILSEKMRGENNPMYGKPVSEEVRRGRSERAKGNNNPAKKPGVGEKIRQSKLGKKRDEFNEEWKENLAKNHKSKQPGFDGSLSEETRKRIGDRIRGRKQTDEEKEIRRKALLNLNLKREKKLCPHCNQEVAVNGYARWHGDNCKHKEHCEKRKS